MFTISNFINKIKTLKPVYFFIVIFVISFVLIVLRRIDVIIYPQFWAEDGTVWYQTAYNLGIKSLFIPHTGYFQTTSRLVALISQLLPLSFAPLFFNLCAIIIKIIPILFIFSVRCRKNFSSLLVPTLISLIYLFLPNSSEVFANITNAHWYLAIIAFLIVTADKAPNLAWKIFDIFFLILIGLSGPFIIFLLPIALIWWWLKRQNGLPWVQIIIISLTS
jgi:hypothetical protein